MNLLAQVLVAGVAAFRLGQMVALEDGPFDLFVLWREKIGADKQQNWVQRGFACPACCSFWAAALCALLFHPAGVIGFLLVWWASAGVAQVLNLHFARR